MVKESWTTQIVIDIKEAGEMDWEKEMENTAIIMEIIIEVVGWGIKKKEKGFWGWKLEIFILEIGGQVRNMVLGDIPSQMETIMRVSLWTEIDLERVDTHGQMVVATKVSGSGTKWMGGVVIQVLMELLFVVFL